MTSEIADQIYGLILHYSRLGVVRATTQERILESPAFYQMLDGQVVAYATVVETASYQKISSVVTHPDYFGQGLASVVVRQAIESAVKHSTKPVVAVTNGNSYALFLKLGFHEEPKETAPEELWGGRTEEEWLECDRHLLVLPQR